MGGKATKKKNGNVYYYYYCNDCKCNIKEETIENHIKIFVDDIVEYDSVVNQFFLPIIKQKAENPIELLEKEINDLKEENSLLKSSLQHFKNLIYNLVHFLMDRIYRNKEKEKYLEFAEELYKHGVLEKEDFELLQDKKNLDNNKKLEIEKDDIER